MENKRVTGFAYLRCALYALAGLVFELLVAALEKMVGVDLSSLSVSQNITHWLITSIGWVLAGLLVIRTGRKTTGFDVWARRARLRGWQYAAIAVCFAVNILVKYLDWGGFKVVLEWKSRGPVLFAFQYLYYLAEGFLISLMIVFAQKACETWFRSDRVPYGGVILGLTWGLAHTFTQGSVWIGLLCALGGFLFGAVYLLAGQDYKKALPIITLLFIL